MPNVESPLLTIKESRDYLRVSESTLRRLINRERIVTVRIGSRILLRKSDLDAYIDECCCAVVGSE